jgi:WD40 repeat protein
MKLACRSAALAVVIITGPVLATPAMATAASRPPAQARVRTVEGLRDRPGAPHAQPPGGTQLWRTAYTLGHGASAADVAVSPDGSQVFVTGSATGPKDRSRITTVAYQAATGAQLWVARYKGPANDNGAATSVVVSPDGQQVFVTGSTHTQAGVDTGVVLAYQAATGANAWTVVTPGTSASSAVISPDGSTLFADDGGGLGLGVTAYATATGATLWSQGSSLQGGGSESAVAVSPDGSAVFVTGRFQVSASTEYETVAFAAATGKVLWTRVKMGVNGSFGDFSGGAALAVSPDSAAVFVTGTLTGPHGAACGTIAYNAATGKQLWLKTYKSDTSGTLNDWGLAVAVSPDGSTVVVTGGADGAYGTIAYAAATGAQQWVALYNPGNSTASAVAVSPDGSTVLVTGTSAKAKTSSQVATLAYNAATGATLWLRRYPGAGNPSGYGEGHALAVNPDGSAVYVAGLFQSPLNKPARFGTIAYSP